MWCISSVCYSWQCSMRQVCYQNLGDEGWSIGEVRWFIQGTQIEILLTDRFAVVGSKISCMLEKCSATELQLHPRNLLHMVNFFPFLTTALEEDSLFFLSALDVSLHYSKIYSSHKTQVSPYASSKCRRGPWDNGNSERETLPTLSNYSFSLFFWAWEILKANLLLSFLSTHHPQTVSTEWCSNLFIHGSMGIWSRASHPRV